MKKEIRLLSRRLSLVQRSLGDLRRELDAACAGDPLAPLSERVKALRIEDAKGLTVRAYQCLYGENIYTVGDVLAAGRSRLSEIPGLGRQSIRNVESVLARLGCALE